VAIAREDHFLVRPGAGIDGGEKRAGAAVYREERAAAPVELCRERFGAQEDPLRVLEIVEALDLGDVDAVGERVPEERGVPFVPRHMHRTDAGGAVCAERFQKGLFRHGGLP
jgi:hypothetical protein